MRFRLRTLMIALALGPPILAAVWYWFSLTGLPGLGAIIPLGALTCYLLAWRFLFGLLRAADRMWMRRFTRLTMGFSRKLENHEAAIGLYFAAYNFVCKHSTIKTTPAVAAGIADRPWTAGELIERTADYNPPTALDRFIDSLPDDE
jgi:hypothetical protein